MLTRRRGLTAALLLGASLLAVLFGQLPSDRLLWRELQNTAHIPLFGVVALTSLFIARQILPLARDKPLAGYLIAGAAGITLGCLTEYGQLLTDRTPSISDLARDLIGIIVGLGLYAGIDRAMRPFWSEHPRGARIGVISLFCFLLAASVYPLARLANAYVERSAAFPVIMDFRASWSRPFVRLKHAELADTKAPQPESPGADQRLTRLALRPGSYPGVSVIELYPDWSQFEYLRFAIFSVQPGTFSLVLRIDDLLHDQNHSDRFNQRLEIAPGENSFRIPLAAIKDAPAARQMDMSRMKSLIVFASNLSTPLDFYLSPMSLE